MAPLPLGELRKSAPLPRLVVEEDQGPRRPLRRPGLGWVLVSHPRGTLSGKMRQGSLSRNTDAAGPPVPQALNLYFSTRLHVSMWVQGPAPTPSR